MLNEKSVWSVKPEGKKSIGREESLLVHGPHSLQQTSGAGLGVGVERKHGSGSDTLSQAFLSLLIVCFSCVIVTHNWKKGQDYIDKDVLQAST